MMIQQGDLFVIKKRSLKLYVCDKPIRLNVGNTPLSLIGHAHIIEHFAIELGLNLILSEWDQSVSDHMLLSTRHRVLKLVNNDDTSDIVSA